MGIAILDTNNRMMCDPLIVVCRESYLTLPKLPLLLPLPQFVGMAHDSKIISAVAMISKLRINLSEVCSITKQVLIHFRFLRSRTKRR